MMKTWHTSGWMAWFATAAVLVLTVLVSQAAEFTIKSAQAAAARGDAKAQFYLSRCYAHGEGVPQDDAKAVNYLRQSANQGYAPAEHNLGAYYYYGLLGMPQNYTESIKWFRQAADQGDPLSEFSLGLAYELGKGVTASLPEAMVWYQKAAKQNQTNALLALGNLYLGGRTLKADYRRARDCFTKAATWGSISALNSLGYIYERGGFGLVADPKKAVKYYLQAAQKEFPKAQVNLGRIYMAGKGVPRDLIEAYKWFYLASQNETGMGQHYLEELDGSVNFGDFAGQALTEEQVQEAIRRADEFEKSLTQKPPSKRIKS